MKDVYKNQIFTLKFLKCPSCSQSPISYFKLLWFINMRVTYKCIHCESCLKLNYSYILEFLVTLFLLAISTNLVESFFDLKIDELFTFIIIVISFLIMNGRKRSLFILI
jgi:hypothetical protein